MDDRADEARPGFGFDPGAPDEVRRYFREKELRPTFAWDDVLPEEHAVAFTVAKATEEDVLIAIRDALQSAIDEGETLAAFTRTLRPRLEALGWWGQSEAVDPDTGEVVDVQLGSARRLRTIYNANVRTAYAAGQWERIQRTKRGLPFLEYRLGPSENHRQQHVLLAGTILSADDPFWLKWYTPNGWGCKCWIRQLTRRAAEDLGISETPQIDTVPFTDRQGRTRQVPIGIDPGWDTNPGQLRLEARQAHLADREATRTGG